MADNTGLLCGCFPADGFRQSLFIFLVVDKLDFDQFVRIEGRLGGLQHLRGNPAFPDQYGRLQMMRQASQVFSLMAVHR